MSIRSTSFPRSSGPVLRAFTLIELLVVVAIIATLAAIAVPNFLEAVARANTVRARSDLRTLAAALEAYRVDNANYPLPDSEEGEPIVDFSDPDEGFETRIPIRLTTPISYLQSLPLDPFTPLRSAENGLYIFATRAYFAVAEDPGEFNDYIEQVFLVPRGGRRGSFYILSRGPDRDHEETVGNDEESGDEIGDDESGPALYDPTNGTISNGDIVYFGPGPGFHL